MADLPTPIPRPFTYQGRLGVSAIPGPLPEPANGLYDFRFRLYNAATGGEPIGSTVTTRNVEVRNGLFSVTVDEFGNMPGPIPNPASLTHGFGWLDLAVRPRATSDEVPWQALAPRQQLLPTPYASHAISANSLLGEGVVASAAGNHLAIHAVGGVGIGTSAPTERLQVDAGNLLVRGPRNFAAGSDAAVFLGDNNNFLRSVWGEGLRLGVFGAPEAVSLANGGQVGIGTTVPQARLHVASTGSEPQLALEQTAADDWARLRLGGAGHSWDLSVHADATPSLNFWNGSANVMTVSYGGTVNATAFNTLSDRAVKQEFTDVDPVRVLERVVALRIREWSFKAETSARHLGPVAQDFYAAFGLGTDNRLIATVDADGVALTAIQGLNRKVEELAQQVRERDRLIEEMKRSLAELELRLKALPGTTSGNQR